ncbi:MAG: SAM-dependent methyltransferase [Bacilli bacterium]|nr:SAM-dependent methyltransferase [Bacilli bacterium]
MLSKRLQSLTKYVNKEDKIIDIGCDHALLDIYLINNNYIDNIIVSDIHDGALQQGINNIELNNLTDKIDARLGNGLEVLNENDDIDTILISGMGTSTIIDILNNKYINEINKLILQSNNDYEELRRYIVSIGYEITDEEYLVDKDKNYINIVFIKGNKEYSDIEYKYGPILIKNKEYLEYMINHYRSVLSYVPEEKEEVINDINNEIEVLSNLLSK